MGETFRVGETKVRPGVYHRYVNATEATASANYDGIGACTIKSNWGPLAAVKTVYSIDDATALYGSGGASGTIAVAEQMFKGGISTLRIKRLGTGGTKGTITLKDASSVSAITVTAKYEGSRAFRYAIKSVLGDETKREFDVYEGSVLLEKLKFAVAESGEVDNLIAAGAASKYFDFVKASGYSGTAKVALVPSTDFTAGTDPTVSNAEYSAAFTALEPYRFNAICVDTNETAVHALLAAYVDRAYEGGKNCFGVVGEPTTIALETRQQHAAAYNDYKIVYVGDGFMISDTTIGGYLAAARVAGLVAAVPSSESLTHRTLTDATDITEILTNSQIIECINSGMIVFTASSTGAVWIEDGITTLINPGANDDAGWKKIKRAKTRMELLTRADDVTEPMIGKVGNTPDGRATVVKALQGLCNDMIAEDKLLAGATATTDAAHTPTGDSAWFAIAVDDIDALEKVYLTYQFRFTPETA
ncbi:MAG: phage tail sheath subtilisin-like domain-containing protein [Eubacteriaceae bacterium]|nr:phage tail sheath subtilisin-like domain-containing protein [Eubacteriaceae bacterium]